jgi:hypothetical protein
MRADLEKGQANGIQCAPPYLFSAIWTVVVAWMADSTKLRMPYMVLNAVITLVGLMLTAYDKVCLIAPCLLEQLVDLYNKTMGSDILESS